MAEKILPARRQTILLGSAGVIGPASGTNNEVAVFSGTTGRILKVADGPITITAGGSNQNITLTPSGTGGAVIGIGGTSTNPSIRWTDADTGIYSEGAGVVNVTADGTQIVQFRSAGPQGVRLIGSSQVGSNSTLNIFSSDVTAVVFDTSQRPTFTPGAGRTTGQMLLTGGSVSTAGNIVSSITSTNTATSGTNLGLSITTTYNQSSGTAANTDIKAYRTQLAVGSGAQNLADFGVASTPWYSFSVGNAATTAAFNSSSTVETAVAFSPSFASQTSTAGWNGIKLNVTDGSGSGTKLLIDAQVGGTSKFKVSNTGAVTAAGTVQLTNAAYQSAGALVTDSSGNVTVSTSAPDTTYGSATAQTAAVSNVVQVTVGASDSSYIISCNVLVTASATHSFSAECAYTDEGNTARVVTFNVQQLSGTLIQAITNVTGVGPYEGVPLHIRCKAATTVTIRTASGGTYTSVTYNLRGAIEQIN